MDEVDAIFLALCLVIGLNVFIILFLHTNQEKQMATLQEVKDKLTNLQTDVTALINLPAGVSEADLQPVADAIDSLDTQVKAKLS